MILISHCFVYDQNVTWCILITDTSAYDTFIYDCCHWEVESVLSLLLSAPAYNLFVQLRSVKLKQIKTPRKLLRNEYSNRTTAFVVACALFSPGIWMSPMISMKPSTRAIFAANSAIDTDVLERNPSWFVVLSCDLMLQIAIPYIIEDVIQHTTVGIR